LEKWLVKTTSEGITVAHPKVHYINTVTTIKYLQMQTYQLCAYFRITNTTSPVAIITCGVAQATKIVGGVNAALNEFPWQVCT